MVKINEGYIKKEDINYLHKMVVNNNMFPWYVLPRPVSDKYPCMSHVLLPRYDYANNTGFKINSDLYEPMLQIIKDICIKHKIKIKRILRAQFNLTWKFRGKYSTPHFDHGFPHKNIIIYLNKFTKGSTYLFKEKYNDKKAKTIIKEMKADKGKYIVFPGENYHAAGFPGKEGELRMICIFTLEEKK
tara:strand:- start:200 stop:760 length:561 start_codon:yes stop_codon:yes gene_type:complete